MELGPLDLCNGGECEEPTARDWRGWSGGTPRSPANAGACVRTPFQARDPDWGEAAGSGIDTEQDRDERGRKKGLDQSGGREHSQISSESSWPNF